jgi:transposase-like protein
MEPVEVITSVQRRRRFSPHEKRAIVEEAEQPDEGEGVKSFVDSNPLEAIRSRSKIYLRK